MLDHFVELSDREIDFISGAGRSVCIPAVRVSVCVPEVKVCIPKVYIPEVKVCDPKPSCTPTNGTDS